MHLFQPEILGLFLPYQDLFYQGCTIVVELNTPMSIAPTKQCLEKIILVSNTITTKLQIKHF